MAPRTSRASTRQASRATTAAGRQSRAANTLPGVHPGLDVTYGGEAREGLGEDIRGSTSASADIRQAMAVGTGEARRSPVAIPVEAEEGGSTTFNHTSGVGAAGQGTAGPSRGHVKDIPEVVQPTAAASSGVIPQTNVWASSFFWAVGGMWVLALVAACVAFGVGVMYNWPSATINQTDVAATLEASFTKNVMGSLKSIHEVQMESITKILDNQILEWERAHRGPNYFSPHLGAYIDSSKTSPTFNDYPKRKGKRSFWERQVKFEPNPPVTALTAFKEAGDCWCAAKSADGRDSKAQLTINTGFEIRPTQLRLEHIHPRNVPHTRTAPKELEIWAEIPDEYYDFVKEEMDYYGEMDKIRDNTLSKNFILLSKFKFDPQIEDDMTIHINPIIGNIEGDHVAVSTLSVRAVTNHGAPYTCLYRVSLFGQPLGIDEAPFGF